jgi:serine-type D-Ala-D-Ala carboxypeptidase/endopeptidase (penicillin-binding protein 4)
MSSGTPMQLVRRRVRALGLALLACGGAAAASAQSRPPLQAAAEQIVAGASGTWGVVAWSTERNAPLFAINPNEALIPASNNKVITAAWALDVLGPEHRFATDLLITGEIENGLLRGDVVIRGSGDPGFGYPGFHREPMAPLRIMAQQLAARGVRAVEGGVIGDPFAFDTVLVGPAWPGDTGGGSAAYAPRVSGLPFQRNMIWVEAVAGPGEVQVRLDPAVDVIPVVASIRSGGGRGWAVRHPNQDTVHVRGAISGRGPHRYGIGVHDPALLTAAALRLALQEAGIQVRGPARVGPTPEGSRGVHRHVSAPLGALIPKLNQDSDNFFAEHLWKAAARQAVGVGSYSRGGPASALHFMQRAGVPAGQLYQFDGSGLSSHSRISANALVRTLVYAHGAPWSDLFHRSMAVAGAAGGTMSRMYRNTPAAGNLHAKTGYIRSVRTLSGYVRAANGDLIAFSFLYNGGNTNGARAVQERLGVLLAEYGSGAPRVPAPSDTSDAEEAADG